jgi:hypothetical protein
MRVGGVSQARRFGANVLSPNLRPTKKETLFWKDLIERERGGIL